MRRSDAMRFVMLAALAVSFALAAPGTALAARVESHVVARTSGPEIVAALLSDLDSVDIGADSATVRVASSAGMTDIHVTYGEVGRALMASKDGSALLALAALPLVGSAFLRFIAFIARLSRS